MSRRATGLSDEIRNKMKDAEKTLEEHKSDQKAINAGNYVDPGLEVIKLFSCSTQLSNKFQLLLNTKIMPNKEVSCFKSFRCCIYLANKC